MKVLKGCPKINTLPLKFGNLKSDGLASPIQVLDGQNIFDISDLCYFWPMNSSREEFGTSEEVSALPRLGYCTKKLQASGPPKLSTTLLQISSNHSTVQEETTKLSTTGGLKMSAGRVVSQRSHGNADYGKRVQLEEMIKIELTQDLNGPAKASLLNKRRLLSAHRPTHKRRLRGGKRNIRLAKDKTTRRVIGEILTTKKITRLDILNDENTEFEVSMNCRSSKATSTETPTGKLSPYQFNCDLKPKISKPGVDCSNWSDELFAREHINKESKSVEFDQNLILKERTPGCVTSSDKIGIQPPSKEDGVQQTTYNLRSRQIYLNKQTENKIKRISASSEALTKANNNVLFPDNFADRKVETNATGEESMESPYPPKQLCSVKIMESLGKVTHSIPEAKRGLKFHINASDDNKCAESSHAIKYLPAMKKSRTKSRPAIVKRISLSIQDSVSRLRAMKQGQVVLESDTPLVTSSYKQFRKKDKRYPCPCPHTGCPRVMASKNALRYHLETHMKLSFPCQMCGKIFGHKLSLNNHMLVHQKPTFECPRCDRKFRKNFPLQRHIQETHQRRPVHECQICAQKFVTYREMYCHRKKHDNRGGRCFFCNVCRTGFTRKTHLATHVTQHSARPDTRFMYRCNYCSDLIVFRTYMSVKLHCLQLHPNDQLPTAFECRLWVVKGTDLVRDNLKMRLPQPQDNFEDDFSFSDRPGAVSRYHQGSVEAFGNEGDIYSSHIETKYMAEAPHRENSRQAPRVIYLAEGSAVNVALDSSVTANVPGVEGIQVGSPVDRSSKSVKPRTIFPNRKMDDELCYINSSSYGKSEMERTFDVFDSPTHVCGETLSRAYFDVPNSSADPVNTADVSSKTDISPIQPADSKFCCFDVGPSDIPMSDVYVDLENSFVGQNVEVPFALDEPEYFLDGKISDTLNSYNGTDRNSVKVDPFLDFWDTESSETTSFDGSGLALENSSFCDDDKSFESGYASGCASYITP
ncbi:uncharacterized protein LOC108677838 isoform X2 [Hyalella azteca]|uniref:Uncharacterized protein LOC108677838 isoform X2 n=1 Tax=Hyalella azteca TaxID=294128 RepID=A0A979FR97_HYAAZ|nr:uncharacterized protein LOC108677838 isoform X2 [Hyalella azteca]